RPLAGLDVDDERFHDLSQKSRPGGAGGARCVQTKSELIDSSWCVRRIASAMSVATESTFTFRQPAARAFCAMVSVAMSSVIADFSRRSIAGPDRTACVQAATTSCAPA